MTRHSLYRTAAIAMMLGWTLSAEAAPRNVPASPATTEPSAPAAPAPEPQRTSASYGDWVVRCDRTGGKKACEAVQTFTIKGREAPFAQVVFVHNVKTDGAPAMTMLLLLPVNLSLEKPPTLAIGGNEGSSFKLLRCLPEGCIASLAAGNDVMASLRGASSSQASFFDAAGQKVNLPLSIKGLTLALDNLLRETASN